jgi:hypothetical protein
MQRFTNLDYVHENSNSSKYIKIKSLAWGNWKLSQQSQTFRHGHDSFSLRYIATIYNIGRVGKFVIAGSISYFVSVYRSLLRMQSGEM